ncbi:MAG TPA: hypothetical protein VF748_15190, partial [Candidatus Acidoferrum sp.]
MAIYPDTTKPSARVKFAKPTLLPQAIGHHTAAVRTLFGLATSGLRKRSGKKMSTRVSGKKRRSGTVHRASGATRKRRKHSAAHLVKGSAAARKHM